MDIRDILARNIRKRRNDLGITQMELGARVGCSGNYIGDLERSEYAASVDILADIAKVFEIEPHQLLNPLYEE